MANNNLMDAIDHAVESIQHLIQKINDDNLTSIDDRLIRRRMTVILEALQDYKITRSREHP